MAANFFKTSLYLLLSLSIILIPANAAADPIRILQGNRQLIQTQGSGGGHPLLQFQGVPLHKQWKSQTQEVFS
jgi:hypothetical protein